MCLHLLHILKIFITNHYCTVHQEHLFYGEKEDYIKIPPTKTVVHLEGGFIIDMTNTVCGFYVM